MYFPWFVYYLGEKKIKMTIPHSSPTLTNDLVQEFQSIFKTKMLQSSELLTQTTKLFCRRQNLDNLFFTQSGTHALFWILRGYNLQPTDEVILPSYVCQSIYQAILAAGARPVLCDVDDYWLMSKETVEKKLTKNTKAIIVVNLFGIELDCAQFRFPNILVLNDVCQSFDSIKNSKLDHGDCIFFSFGPTKYITAGMGGAFSIINTNKYFHNFLSSDGLSSPLSDLNLILLQNQISEYDTFIKKRKQIANCYIENLKKDLTKEVALHNNSFYRFPIVQRSYGFEIIQKIYLENLISVRRGVDHLIHRGLGISDDMFPNSVKSFNQTLSIPIYPSISDNDLNKIVSVTKEIFS